MKRTFTNVTESSVDALSSSVYSKSKKVKNALGADTRFLWPVAADTESTSSSSSCDGDDDYDFFTSDIMGDEDWFNEHDTITEDDWHSVATLECNPGEMQHPDGDVVSTSTAGDETPAAATPMMNMDPECYHYFQAEYAKYVESTYNSPGAASGAVPPVSFEDFVVVTLEMIASFTQAKANKSAVPSSQVDTSFDFSIQNWQKKVEKKEKAPQASRHGGLGVCNSLLYIAPPQDELLATWQYDHQDVDIMDDHQFQFCDGDDFALQQPIYCF